MEVNGQASRRPVGPEVPQGPLQSRVFDEPHAASRGEGELRAARQQVGANIGAARAQIARDSQRADGNPGSPSQQQDRGMQPRQVKRTIFQQGEAGNDAYWSNNRWGPQGRAQAVPLPNTLEAKKARKHYQQPTMPIVKPDAEVFASLNELENLMRVTLAALANFNEDERMLLTKQFRKEEQKA
ncbi:hypothetical protein Vretifemale_3336, partial [Volvox reticuliferus]